MNGIGQPVGKLNKLVAQVEQGVELPPVDRGNVGEGFVPPPYESSQELKAVVPDAPTTLTDLLKPPSLAHPDDGDDMRETPRARRIMLLLAQGLPRKVVAQHVGCSLGHISKLSQQPWFRDKIAVVMSLGAAQSLNQSLSVARDEAIEVTRNLMHFAASEEVKRGAAATLLKATLGEKINLQALPTNLEDLERAIKQREAEIAALTQPTQVSAPAKVAEDLREVSG